MISISNVVNVLRGALGEAAHTPASVWITIIALVTLIYALILLAANLYRSLARRVPATAAVPLGVFINETSSDVDKIWLTTSTRTDQKLNAYELIRLQGVDGRNRRIGKSLLVELRPRNNSENPERLQRGQIEMSSTLFNRLFPGEVVPESRESGTASKKFLLAKHKPQKGFDLYWNNVDPQTRFQNRLTFALTAFGIFLGAVSLLPLIAQVAYHGSLASSRTDVLAAEARP